jgi:predicted  nucleic acid-binding Zn-ribbon protein
VSDISVKEQIRKIIELQKVDGEIHNLKIELKEKPVVLAELKEGFELCKSALATLEEKLKGVQVARKEKELELKTKEDEIAKANAQLSQIKTNKEYTAKISEIEHIKADKSIAEEKILMSYDESDAVNVEIKKEKVKVDEEEKKYSAKKKETEASIKVIEDRIKVLDSQRSQATDGIDPSFLSRYERILRHKDGIAIVPVQNEGSCGGCHMNVTPQQINAIKMQKELVECEMCSRIFYLEDDC